MLRFSYCRTEASTHYGRAMVTLSVQKALGETYSSGFQPLVKWAQLQQALSARSLEQAHSSSDSGVMNTVNHVSADVQRSYSRHLSRLCNLPGHRHPLWHQRTPTILYLIFQ